MQLKALIFDCDGDHLDLENICIFASIDAVHLGASHKVHC